MKGSFGIAVVIIALSLAVWIFFYSISQPLAFPETTVVVGICAGIVLCGKWAWNRIQKKEAKNEKKT